MGGLMLLLWVIRLFAFKLYESPKYLMGRGRDAEAVEVVHKVAEYNGKTSTLTVELLTAVDLDRKTENGASLNEPDVRALEAVRTTLHKLSPDKVKKLFATKKLAYSTTLLIILWGKSFFFTKSSLS
jgi:hypothetical protein